MPYNTFFSYDSPDLSLGMFFSLPLSLLYALPIQITILGIFSPHLGVAFDAKAQFSWVDSSCDSVTSQVNTAGDDFNALVAAAIANLEGGFPTTELGKATLLAYWGTDVGTLINSKYGRLQAAFAAQPIALGLYCDGSAFEWVTTYQEGPKQGQAVPNNGQWHSMEGRYNPAEGPLYLSGTKTLIRTSICQDPSGKNAQSVSGIGGKHIILCPDAFAEPVLGAVPPIQQPLGTSLDTLTSTGAVLLHEATHCILGTKDVAYKIGGVLLTGKFGSGAQSNADTWMYYAMASIASQNAWVVGLAQALNDFGPNAPKGPSTVGKRGVIPLAVHDPRAVPDDDLAHSVAMLGSPILEARSPDSVTVTVTVTVTKDCPGAGTSGSTSAGLTGTNSINSSSTSGWSTGSSSTGGGSMKSVSALTGSTGSDPAVSAASSNSASRVQSASSAISTPNTNTASGFTTMKSDSGSSAVPVSSGGYIGPVPISPGPASMTSGLTTFTGTTTPIAVEISSSVSSNAHTKETNGVGPFPVFWSHTCWVSFLMN